MTGAYGGLMGGAYHLEEQSLRQCFLDAAAMGIAQSVALSIVAITFRDSSLKKGCKKKLQSEVTTSATVYCWLSTRLPSSLIIILFWGIEPGYLSAAARYEEILRQSGPKQRTS